MNQDQLNEKLVELCKQIGEETGSPPVGAVLFIEWPNSEGGVAVTLPANQPRAMMLALIDSISRRMTTALQRLKVQINTVS